MPARKSTGGVRGRPAKSAAAASKAAQTKLAFHGSVSKKVDDAESKKISSKTEAIESPKAEVIEVSLDKEEHISATTDTDLFPVGLSTLELDDDETDRWRNALRDARKVSDSKIKTYWGKKEKDRITPRVHQEGMSLHEKLLADWDIDSRYGPCTGINRTQRWQRAHLRYELDPPMEVLAVLLKENTSNPGKAENSRIGTLMAAVGAA